jgi:hypothetical protein
MVVERSGFTINPFAGVTNGILINLESLEVE